jgi:hypothetical protein
VGFENDVTHQAERGGGSRDGVRAWAMLA